MPETLYSFGATEALLETLSASSAPNLSPFDLNSSSSTKSSYYSDSPNENNFLQQDWNKFDDTDFALPNDEDDFIANNEDLFQSPTTTNESISPPFINNQKNVNVKLEFDSIKEEDEDEDFGDFGDLSSNNEDHESKKSSINSIKNNKITKPKRDRSSHTVIEKKYRTNINTKITTLRDSVPSLRVASGDKKTKIDDLDGLSPPSKVNKATIFTKATEYIKHLEKRNSSLFEENQQLKQMLSSYAPQPTQSPTFNFNQPVQQPLPQPQQQSRQPQQLSQFQPALDINGNPINLVTQAQPNYQVGLPGKLLMGGLTMMAGQTMFNGGGVGGNNNNQYGLSAFPILANPSFGIFINIVKGFILLTSLVYIFVPNLFVKNINEDKTKKELNYNTKSIQNSEWYELIKQLIFINTGDLKKIEISEIESNRLINKNLINSENQFLSIANHVFLLLKLHTYKSNFEVSFGKIIVSKLLLSYSNLFTNIFFINTKLNEIINENLTEILKNQKIHEPSLRYFFKEFNNPTSSLQNSESFKRLLNLSLGLKLDLNCIKGHNDKGYEMILKDEQVINDYKTLLLSFRSNELFCDTLLEYIKLTFNDNSTKDLSNEELKELKVDIWNKLNYCEHLSLKNSIINTRIQLFKSICNEKYLDAVLKLINDETEEVKTFEEPQDIPIQKVDPTTETEEDEDETEVEEQLSEESQDEEDDEAEAETEDRSSEASSDASEATETTKSSRQVTQQFKKILSQDLYNSLVCATVLKSINLKNEDEVFKLLKHLKFNKDEITIFSFISMFKIVEKFPKDWIADGEKSESFQLTLNQIIMLLRLWIGESTNINSKVLENEGIEFKREICDKLVDVSKKFNDY